MESRKFFTLVLAIAIAGMSQGLTLPLLSIMIETAGYSSTLNGWNAAALYIGMFFASFFVEKPLRRFGYKKMLLFGVIVVFIASAMIPFWEHLWWWFMLRFMIGVGDSALHYTSQLWITSSSPAHLRGRSISIYGLAYGSGFMIGPFGVNLSFINEYLPFIVVCALYFISFLFVIRLENEFPAQVEQRSRVGSYRTAFAIGWFALIPAFMYGYLEAVLNGSFPIYALRTGIGAEWVPIILFSFAAGGIITQLPLGMLSDRIGRKKVLMGAALIGSLAFLAVPLMDGQVSGILILAILAGSVVGSFFSLGLAFLADTLPGRLLPTGNALAAILFSIGSIIGPSVTGTGIEHIHPNSLFYSLSLVFIVYFLLGLRPSKSSGSYKQPLKGCEP
ncbi:hypothetical protein BEP19_14050 [Ammoniphilus oxalaticus]|uniref:Major facilitator superfamily (MFS) profile domain-containing protein n=1 Tax=Ammoniphilus oxalaticus TaxID=66863 RepID=A0A419SEU9_9BACL|nr:MFS transporter [Ammoniphilus oxalaticus]RKD21744.1 hypothetical protein BEP19_14050 [Ammoniphilus oxalaticus]